MKYKIKRTLMAISALALFLPAAYVAVHVAENANEAKKNADFEFEKITQINEY